MCVCFFLQIPSHQLLRLNLKTDVGESQRRVVRRHPPAERSVLDLELSLGEVGAVPVRVGLTVDLLVTDILRGSGEKRLDTLETHACLKCAVVELEEEKQTPNP